MLALRLEAWGMPRMEVSTAAATISMLVLREFATKLYDAQMQEQCAYPGSLQKLCIRPQDPVEQVRSGVQPVLPLQ